MQKRLKKEEERRKTLKNEDKEKRIGHGKSNNNNKHLWFYLLYKQLYFTRKNSSEKIVYIITFHLQFLCVAGYFKGSNYTSKLMWISISA